MRLSSLRSQVLLQPLGGVGGGSGWAGVPRRPGRGMGFDNPIWCVFLLFFLAAMLVAMWILPRCGETWSGRGHSVGTRECYACLGEVVWVGTEGEKGGEHECPCRYGGGGGWDSGAPLPLQSNFPGQERGCKLRHLLNFSILMLLDFCETLHLI